MNITNEKAFEESIEQSLLEHGGYVRGDSNNYNRELAIDPTVLFKFIKDTQKNTWDSLVAIHGAEVEKKFLYRLNQELDNRGMLDCLRHGITDYGKKFNLAYFKPVSKLNPETQGLYDKNILTVYRQVHYSTKNESSVDMVLSVNGLPVATIELKNSFTGQDVDDAKRQYKYNRDERELLFQFKKRALVHFAVDTDEVYMTTRIQGSKTKYLPFNLGFNKGAGNPPNPNGHKTSYLWEQVLAKDIWMNILARFLHLEIKEKTYEGKTIKIETMIFPRYHQLDVVRRLTEDALKDRAGKNYLIQHSAGSGKSNSIAWLAYHLAGLHDNTDKRIFDSVIVITDRIVLDKQLQDTIYQFEHKSGVVEKIDKDSAQLAKTLTSGTNIIITTLQKFPFVLDKVHDLPKRTYVVIVDEAHSSQSGESAKKMKEVLTVIDTDNMFREKREEYNSNQDEENDVEDEIRKSMLERGPQPNEQITLQKDSDAAIKPITEAGTRKDKEEYATLSEIIKLLNERFGTDFTEADKLFFDQIEEEMVLDEKLSLQAKTNTIDNFKYGFEDIFIAKLVDRMDQNQDIFNKIMEDKAFEAVVKDYLLKKVYNRLTLPMSDEEVDQ